MWFAAIATQNASINDDMQLRVYYDPALHLLTELMPCEAIRRAQRKFQETLEEKAYELSEANIERLEGQISRLRQTVGRLLYAKRHGGVTDLDDDDQKTISEALPTITGGDAISAEDWNRIVWVKREGV